MKKISEITENEKLLLEQQISRRERLVTFLKENNFTDGFYLPTYPFVPEDELMSEAEIKVFLDAYLIYQEKPFFDADGFIFLLKTILELANQDPVGLQDLCNNLIAYTYRQSVQCEILQDNYVDKIHVRYRTTDYKQDFETLTKQVLDLSPPEVKDNLIRFETPILVKTLAQEVSQND